MKRLVGPAAGRITANLAMRLKKLRIAELTSLGAVCWSRSTAQRLSKKSIAVLLRGLKPDVQARIALFSCSVTEQISGLRVGLQRRFAAENFSDSLSVGWYMHRRTVTGNGFTAVDGGQRLVKLKVDLLANKCHGTVARGKIRTALMPAHKAMVVLPVRHARVVLRLCVPAVRYQFKGTPHVAVVLFSNQNQSDQPHHSGTLLAQQKSIAGAVANILIRRSIIVVLVLWSIRRRGR